MTTGGRAKFGIDLDELRLLVGLSYRELARRTGCARSTLHDALSGRRFPRLDTVLAIARACGGDTTCWRDRWVAANRLALGRSGAAHGADDVAAVDQAQLTGVL